jgi:hypothetical protein
MAEAHHERTPDSPSGSLPQKPAQLGYIQPVAANDSPVQKQDRHIQPMAPREDRVAVHVYYFNRR